MGGPTEEDPHCLVDMGHANDLAWTTRVTDAWCAVRHRAFAAARAAGGWFWQMFSLFSTPPQAACAATLRALCAAGASSTFYNATTMHALTGDHATLPNLAQDLAVFLLLRGDYAVRRPRPTGTPHVARACLTRYPLCFASRHFNAVAWFWMEWMRRHLRLPAGAKAGLWHAHGLLHRDGGGRLRAAVDQGGREDGLQRVRGDGDDEELIQCIFFPRAARPGSALAQP